MYPAFGGTLLCSDKAAPSEQSRLRLDRSAEGASWLIKCNSVNVYGVVNLFNHINPANHGSDKHQGRVA